jgi:hypothetical protein
MTRASPAETIDPLLIELGRKYLWWRPINGQHSRDRMVAQVMNLGTYNDIRRLEKVLKPADLAKVARRAAAGWFTPRSWEFWRGRLAASGYRIPGKPPRRSFDAPKV